MSLSKQQIEDQLLAYHLGWLDRAEMEAVERLIESSPELADRSRALRQAVEPLADWDTLPAVENLEAQVLARIQRETGAALMPARRTIKLDAVPARERVLRLPLSLKEMMVEAASVMIILTVVVPSLGKASARAQRTACKNNLRQIGAALVRYGYDNDLQLPYAGPADANWSGDRTSDPQRLRNSRNRYLLLNQGYLKDAARFNDPADSAAVVMQVVDASRFDDCDIPQNCSYDSQIMIGGGQRLSQHPLKVVYADSNPIFDDAGVSADDADDFNSTVHRRLSGQNVLRSDGSAHWADSPNAGVQNDNIWQIGGLALNAGDDWPQLATDSFMIP